MANNKDTSCAPQSTFQGRVRSMSSDGRGVVEGPEGRVFFVENVWTGDLGDFEIVERKKNFGVAKLVQLLDPSPERKTPDCPHSGWSSGQCGACPWQIADYSAQLKAKQNLIQHSLKKLRLEENLIKNIWPSPLKWGYRNRAQFKTDGQALGFVSPSSQQLAPIKDCLVLSETNRNLLKQLQTFLPTSAWKPQKGHPWNTIDVDEDFAQELGSTPLIGDIPLNRRRPFRQANNEQNQNMKMWLHKHLQHLDKNLNVLELFAGSGNFTEVIAQLEFTKICAAEVVDEAMNNLKAKHFSNVTTVAADLFKDSSYQRIKSKFPKTDILVLDPPRDGLKEKTGLLRNFPDITCIAYISCDLATFTRDLFDFNKAGFNIKEIQPIDQFPHTPHIEIMAWLEK